MVMERIEYFGYVEEFIKPIIKPTHLARSTLLSVFLVNKAWAAEAIRILWKNPPVTALAAIKDRDRRQFYACHVQKLEVHHHECKKWIAECSNLRDVTLPLLKFIGIYAARDVPACDLHLCVECCMGPSLEIVSYQSFHLDSKILDLLRTQCPNLKRIAFLVDAFHEPAGINALTELVDSCKCLRSITLYSFNKDLLIEALGRLQEGSNTGDSGVQHERLLRSIAHCNGLEQLAMNTIHEYKTFSMVLRSLERPFEDLSRLSLWTVLETRSASLLVSKLNPRSLTYLDLNLRIDGITTNLLPLICSRLVNLQHLSLNYVPLSRVDETERAFWTPLSDMLPLKNLKHLRHLTIHGLLLLPKLTDEVFIPMVENWPKLDALELRTNSELSTTSLNSLGKLCPRLGYLSIDGAYDLTDWQNIPRPIFPHLWGLSIYGSVDCFLDREGESQ